MRILKSYKILKSAQQAVIKWIKKNEYWQIFLETDFFSSFTASSGRFSELDALNAILKFPFKVSVRKIKRLFHKSNCDTGFT